jgi:hypothetical protein
MPGIMIPAKAAPWLLSLAEVTSGHAEHHSFAALHPEAKVMT